MSSGFVLQHVTKYRHQPGPDGKSRRVAVLQDISLEVPAGSLCVVMGPSGSGKSTLLRLLNRLDDPEEGEIRLDGISLSHISVIELRRRVVMVGQQPTPFPGTVAENLAYGLRLQALPEAEIQQRVTAALEQVGLTADLMSRPAEQLSVGQQQRMCLARALVLRPQVLLLDEPTSALDPNSAETVIRSVRALQQEHALTVVYVTHRLAEAQELGGTSVILVEGKLAETSPTNELLTQPRTEAARAFLRARAEEEPTA